MTKWKITIKEVNRIKPIVTYHSGNKSYTEVMEFFGCNEPDVEWFRIEKE